MEFDLMSGASTWAESARLATELERVGFSGMLYTETSQVPWMQIAAAATAAPTLTFTTGIAVAFPRSPMVSAAIAWELAHNTEGRFRLGLGSQVKAHIQRRYGAEFAPPGPRLRDYVLAVKACFRAFRGDEKLEPRRRVLPPQPAPSAVGAAAPRLRRHQGRHLRRRSVHDTHGGRGGRRRPRPPVPLDAVHPRTPRPGRRRRRRAGGACHVRHRLHRPRVRHTGRHARRNGHRWSRRPRPRSRSTARRRTTPSSSTTSDSKGRPPVWVSGCGPVTCRAWRR